MPATSKSYPSKARKPVAISMPAKPAMPARSNKGGAVRGKARAAQVQAMNSGQRKSSPSSVAAAKKRSKSSTGTERARAQNRREVFASLVGNPTARPQSAPAAPAKRSAGLNPFGVPAAKILDAIINSQRKK